MFGPIHTIAFDLDGTLVNTMASVAQGMQIAIEHASGKKIPIPELYHSFGPSPRGVLEKWLPAEQIEVALERWLQFDHEQGGDTFQPFDGVEEMLRELREHQVPIGIFTGRDRHGTLRILRALNWHGVFFDDAAIVCGDEGHRPKPSPEGLLKLVKRMNWIADKTLMVGDHEHDVKAGRDANAKTAIALWDQTFIEGPTNRARFKTSWEKWDQNENIDLRLAKPQSLSEWIRRERS